MARPSGFNNALKETMVQLYVEGKTDKQVAEIVGVCEKTIANWKGKHPEFLQALRKSKQIADELVEASLFSRATGYSHPEEKIFCHEGVAIIQDTIRHYPPDTTAAIFWLKNRQPNRWREKQPGEADVIINNIVSKSDDELDARIQELISKGQGDEFPET